MSLTIAVIPTTEGSAFFIDLLESQLFTLRRGLGCRAKLLHRGPRGPLPLPDDAEVFS